MPDPLPKPVRLQRSRAKGARLVSPNGRKIVVCTRPGKWGNPFRTAAEYREWVKHRKQQQFVEDAKSQLRGCDLACWCRLDADCHVDTLLEIANA